MTIALGILANDGVVVAADRQITVTEYMKLDQGKAGFVARLLPDPSGPTTILITGAGSMTSIQHLRQGLTGAFMMGSAIASISDVRTELGRQIEDFHTRHVVPDGTGALAASMIVGVKDSSKVKLWVTDRSVVNEESTFATVGAGAMYASILLSRLYGPMDTMGAILLAAYVIHEVKQTIDGCGNDTDIFASGWNTNCVYVERSLQRRLEEIFRQYSEISRETLHHVFNDHIRWGSKRKLSTEVRKLRREVEKIVEQMEALPRWAKNQDSSPTSSESSQT